MTFSIQAFMLIVQIMIEQIIMFDLNIKELWLVHHILIQIVI